MYPELLAQEVDNRLLFIQHFSTVRIRPRISIRDSGECKRTAQSGDRWSRVTTPHTGQAGKTPTRKVTTVLCSDTTNRPTHYNPSLSSKLVCGDKSSKFGWRIHNQMSGESMDSRIVQANHKLGYNCRQNGVQRSSVPAGGTSTWLRFLNDLEAQGKIAAWVLRS